LTQSGGGGEYSLGTATLTLRGDMQPLERDLARMRAVIAEMEKRGANIPAPNIPAPKPPPPETQRGYQGLAATMEALRRGVQGDGEAFTMLSQQLRGASQAAAAAGGSGGFGGATNALAGMLGMAGRAIPILGQLGLAATGLQAIFGGLQGAVNAVLAPLQQLSAEAGRLNKQVAEAGIFAAQSFAILGPDGKLVEGTARQMQMVRGAILKEYQGIQKEVANISGATASEIYDGFNIILQNVSALGEKGTMENSAKLATRLAAGMNTLNIPTFQLRQEANALLMGNIGPDAMLAKKLGITNDDVRQQQAKGTYYDFLMGKLEKLYEGQKVLALSLENVKSNFDDVNQAISSEAGQPLERDTASMMQTILVTFKNLQGSFSGFFKSIAEAVGPIIKVFGPVISVLTSIGAIASSVGRVIMDVVGVATAALGFVLQPVLVTIARFVELIAKGWENIANLIGGAISPIKALFNASGDADVDGVNTFFDRLIEGAETAGKAIDSFNKKWAQAVLNFRLFTMRAAMTADGASEKEIQEAQLNFRENFNRQTNLAEPVELRSLQLPADVLERIEAREQRLGSGATRALNISKEWSEIKQKAYQNEIKALEQGLTLMNKQREVAEAMSAVAASRRALEARGYELGVQVAFSPEAKATAEARLADLKLRQEKEAIAERRGILQTERELQQRQMLIQEKQIKIQQEQLKIQLAEATAEQVKAQKERDALLRSQKNTPLYSAEWGKNQELLSINAAELTRINAKLEGSRRAVQLAFEAEGQLGTINGLEAQRLGLQEQQLDIQGQQAQYTREQQQLLAEISEAEQNISNMLDEIVNKENAKRRELEDQSEEINRQNTLLERQRRLEEAQAELAMTREKAAVQAAERLAEVQELQDRARSGGGTAAVIEAQIAAAAAGVSGMESAAAVQQRLFDAKEQQMAREHQLAQKQLEVQHKIEEIKLRSEKIAMERQKVDIAIERARLTAELGRLRLGQMKDEIAPRLAGSSSVPALAGVARLPGSITGRLDASGQNGADMPVGRNNEIFSYHNGVVTEISRAGNNGNYTVIEFIDDLGNKLEATYSHMTALVKVGQQVVGGQVLGRFDASGRTSGPHNSVDINSPGTNGALQRNAETAAARRSADLLVTGKVQGQAGGSSVGAPPAPILPAAPAEANLAGYLKRLSYLETRIRNVPNAEGSGAQGYFQTKNAFHQEATAASGGMNSRSANYAESAKAVAAWIKKHRPVAYDHIAAGRFDQADAILRQGTWPSLPGGSQAQADAIQLEARKFLPAAGSVASTVAAVGGVVAPSTANQAEALQQSLKDVDSAETRLGKQMEDLTQAIKDLDNLFSVKEENLTEQQLAERAQLAYERTKAQLTAEVMRTPEGRLAISTGDAVSGSISGSISGALQALLTGGDVKAAVSSALAQAGQTLMQATLDALLNPLLSQLQGGIVKAFTGIDIQGRALQMAAAAHQNAASAHQAAAVQVANAGAAVAAAAGASGAAAVGDSANVWGTLASKIPSLISGFAGLGGGLDLASGFAFDSVISGPDFVAGPMLDVGSMGLSYTPGFAGGGDIQYGLDYLVGEKNAEIVRFNKAGGKVYSNRALTKALGVPFQRSPGGGAEVADGGGDSLGIPFMAPGPNQSAGGRAAPPIPFLKSSPAGGGMAGSGPGGAPPSAMAPSKALRLKVETTVINGVEYATVEQVHQAAAAAAAASRDAVYNDLRNNPSIQRSVGLG
jgi:murein DD-endopeptidase MepM/ murein hydrolase activator NlpD